jgi:hypothetical protein
MSQILIDLQYISRRAGEAGSANVTSHSQLVDHHTAGQHQLLDVAQAQRETVIQPYRVSDDLDRIPVALVPRRNRHNGAILAAPRPVNNLTMPLPV